MPVIIKYIVERNGVERMTFASKQEADAYDKMLDTADQLQLWLSQSMPALPEDIAEQLALEMAKQKDELQSLLSGKPVKAKTKPAEEKAAKASEFTAVELAAVELTVVASTVVDSEQAA